MITNRLARNINYQWKTDINVMTTTVWITRSGASKISPQLNLRVEHAMMLRGTLQGDSPLYGTLLILFQLASGIC
jgi:hypothetical protein